MRLSWLLLIGSLMLPTNASAGAPPESTPSPTGPQPAGDGSAAPARAVDPGPLWPAYELAPGPRGEPVASVLHPLRLNSLIVAAGAELDACFLELDACHDEALQEARQRAEDGGAPDARATSERRSGGATGAPWTGYLAWGLGGAAVGLVGGVALVMWLGAPGG